MNSPADDANLHSFKMTRRRLLGYAAGVAAGGLASALLPPNVQRALGALPDPARRGSLKNIKHVVLLMQENRSFDHYFGTMSGVRGFSDPNALTLDTGKSVFFQPDVINPDGYLLPFHLNTRTSSAQKIPSTDHGWVAQHESWNGGKMDKWLEAHRKADHANGPFVMGYHDRDDIPFHFALAEAFTVCDAYHCSVMGPTWPNRMYWMTGTVDAAGKNGGPVLGNNIPKVGYKWKTYPERLEEAGISWKVYHEQPDDYGLNVLGCFEQYRQAPPNSALATKAMAVSSAGQFESDAKNDKLPAVSWILPPKHLSEHPDYMPAAGAAFVAAKVDAIAANPEVWAKTVFILDYDENDGLFDHVAPPVPPPGTPDEFVKGLPIGGGFRVPCIVVSPWTAGGWVCSQPFDHTSVVQFLEKFTGVQEPNISAWRRQAFGDMTSAFRFDQDKSQQPPSLPDANSALTQAQYGADHLPHPVPPDATQMPPAQEKGSRKRISPSA